MSSTLDLKGMRHLSDIPSNSEFARFQTLIFNKIGVFLPQQKRAMLGHRLVKRLRATGCKNFGHYFKFISSKNHCDELQQALELVTTNETFFFREEKHFKYLIDEVLKNFPSEELLRIWCGASSTGEEPYSLAMTLNEHSTSPWQLLATDVNQTVLKTAIKAIYADERTSGIPDGYRKKYCKRGTGEFDGYLRITPEIRQKTNFKYFNLLNNMDVLGQFDVVFLRNVMIYFKDETKHCIVNRIAKNLKPGGYLFIGHSETLYGISEYFNLVKPSIYQRK